MLTTPLSNTPPVALDALHEYWHASTAAAEAGASDDETFTRATGKMNDLDGGSGWVWSGPG